MQVLALCNRTFRSTGRTPVYKPPGDDRPAKYKEWSNESMKGAYAAVKSDEYSVCDASITFGIPYSTLHDRVTGKVQFGSHSGPRRFLDDAEETELVNFLCGAASMGFARSKK